MNQDVAVEALRVLPPASLASQECVCLFLTTATFPVTFTALGTKYVDCQIQKTIEVV